MSSNGPNTDLVGVEAREAVAAGTGRVAGDSALFSHPATADLPSETEQSSGSVERPLTGAKASGPHGLRFVWWHDAGREDVDKSPKTIDLRAAFAESLAMFLFVTIGCGVACSEGGGEGKNLIIALAFGLAITVLAYTIGHHSGGQINCAVTFSLVLGGALPWRQGLFNFVGQMVGSMLAALFLSVIFTCEADKTGTLGSNTVAEDYSYMAAFLAEIFGTFLLCFVVYQTAVHPRNGSGSNAPLAIGLAVFVAHALLIPITGCSINPTRSFGPAVVGLWRSCSGDLGAGFQDLWLMWAAPLFGAALAAGCQKAFADARAPAPARSGEKVGKGI